MGISAKKNQEPFESSSRELKPLRDEKSTYELIPGIDAISWVSDPSLAHFKFVSGRAFPVLGYAKEQWLKDPSFWQNLMSSSARSSLMRAISVLPLDESNLKLEHQAKSKDDKEVWLRTSIYLDRGSQGEIRSLNGLSVDISDYKRNEQRFQKSLRELEDVKLALDQTSVVAITDTDGQITHVNDLFCDFYGYTREEVIGKNHRMFKSGHHPKSFYKELWDTIQAGRIFRGEVMNKAKDGSYYWAHMTIIPFLDVNGCPYQYVSIRTDITSLKRAEGLQDEYLRGRLELEKSKSALQARDQFVSAASHELKTPITSLQVLLELSLNQCREDATRPGRTSPVSMLETALFQTKRLTGIVNDMLDASRIAAGKIVLEPEAVDLAVLVKNLIFQHREDFRIARCEVELEAPGSVSTFVDRSRMEQVVINLLTNAMKYGRGKPILIKVKSDEKGAALSVSDQGIGIPEAFKHQLFERFERAGSAKAFKGVGLGLWICKQIVDAHEGIIEVESEEGKGATFTVRIPERALKISPKKLQEVEEDPKGLP